MCFRFLSLLMILTASAAPHVLQVCADPNNLPFSNKSQQGFENRIADLIARDLGARVENTWWTQRKSFWKDSLKGGHCDVWFGAPADIKGALTTTPYYRSSYVFVSRADRNLELSSLFDERLERFRIGIHVVGDDFAPPAQLLARRGISANLIGFSLFGEAGEPSPPAKLLAAVSSGDVDVAIVWGPLAGYFAKREPVPLRIQPVQPAFFAGIPFTYEISAAVREEDEKLKTEIEAALKRECKVIDSILREYNVPRVAEGVAPCESSQSSPVSRR